MEENKLSSKKISLKVKIFLFFTFCFLSTSIFFFIFPIFHFDLKNKKSLEEYGELTIENISRLLINPLWFIDMKAVLDICDYALKDNKINCIKLTDENGNILYNYDGEKSFKPRSHLVLKRKIFRSEINIGSIEISFYDKQYETAKNSTLFIFLLYFFVVFLIYFTILYFFLRFSFDASFKIFIKSLNEFKENVFKNNLIRTNEYTSEISKIIYEIRDNFKNESEEIKNLKIDLERKIEAKTIQAEIVSKDLESKLKEFQESQDFFTKNEKNAALEQFVIGISHELNTPLGAALSSGRSLNLKILNEVKKHSKYYLSFSKEEIEFINDALNLIIENKLFFNLGLSYVEKKKIYLKYEKINVDDKEFFINALINTGIYRFEDISLKLLKYKNYKEIFSILLDFSDLLRLANVINSATEKSASIIDALKKYAKMEIEENEKEPLDLTKEIDEVLLLFNNDFANSVELIKKYESKKMILGNRNKLNQVWSNIISNALEAMSHKGTLTVSIEEEKEFLLISFIDTGIGIEDKNKKYIFNPFFTTKKFGEGLGLGLNISKKIIDEHKGSVYFTSIPGETVFYVKLKIIPEWINEINDI